MVGCRVKSRSRLAPVGTSTPILGQRRVPGEMARRVPEMAPTPARFEEIPLIFPKNAGLRGSGALPKIKAMLRWRWWFLLIWLSGQAVAGIVWQPVMDYPLSFPKERPDGLAVINPFENFTHLGTDFGMMGPGESRIESKGGPVKVKKDGGWTGFWHSLAGLAVEAGREMDLTDVTGLLGPAETRCPVRAVTLNIRGTGEVRVELADVARRPVWESRSCRSPPASSGRTRKSPRHSPRPRTRTGRRA